MRRHNQGGSSLIIVVIIVVILGICLLVWRLSGQQTAPPSDTGQQSLTDPNEGHIVIKEWGVRFKPVSGLSGVQYYKTKVEGDYFAFTTQELAKADPNCSTESDMLVLATLTRLKEDEAGIGRKRGPINGYNYYSRGSDAACSSSQFWQLESTIKSMILQSFDSLEATK